MLQRILIVILFIFIAIRANAGNDVTDTLKNNKDASIQTYNGYEYKRPKPFHFIKCLPFDVWDYSKATFRKEQINNIALMLAGTAALIALDQPIVDGAQKLGDHIHLAHDNNQYPLFERRFSVGGNVMLIQFNVPFNVPTALYFMGDGITHFSIAGAFWFTGLATHDYRALQTSSQLVECILATGFAVQLLKHLTGHEDPYVATARGGVWRLFPNQADYSSNIPHYDAFPSGHLATAMATITVIASNYSEYHFIKPIGYTLMGVLGYTMLNNGVHWASDYPLGIAIGYVFAKIAINKGRTVASSHVMLNNKGFYNKIISKMYITPSPLFTGDAGMKVGVKF